MNLEDLLKNNLIKKVNPDFKQINLQIIRAKKDLETSKSLMAKDLTWALTIIYHSMLRISRAMMYSKGFLPTTKNTHKTIVEFTKYTLGTDFYNLINRFDRLRRQRHNFIYESENNITLSEVNRATELAKELFIKIEEIIIKENPQKNLFL